MLAILNPPVRTNGMGGFLKLAGKATNIEALLVFDVGSVVEAVGALRPA
jgi:hypothetical protein